MTRYLFALSVVILCSCGDDITKNTYIQEPSSLEMRTDFTEPCDPGEGAMDTTGRLWICGENGNWYRREHFVDTIFKWQKDTVVITKKDTIILIETDTTSNPQNLCGAVKYDSATHFCDERDNRVYRWVKIGNQTWMAENLNYGTMVGTDNLGKPIFLGSPVTAQKACYNNDEDICDIHGGLYSRDASQRACPGGWHMPDSLEWQKLTNYAIENHGSVNALRSSRIWYNEEHENDPLGFGILPSGYFGKDIRQNDNYIGIGTEYKFCVKWTNSSFIDCTGGGVASLASIRCVKDDTDETVFDDTYNGTKNRTINISAGAGVLSNDLFRTGESVSATKLSEPVHGTVVLYPNGAFSYEPDDNWTGTDAFSYRACSSATGVCGEATVTIVIS